ncbi:hypothetical protein B0H16DRAFT_1638061 [Mycena metata]|uniref:F-box domain-containing protein n=1 Tax=Mycena metata TaxID=1033252 RepID=A0AAD7GSD0_9AGAR|nr:hypothetical protein B0H16DRAFT_1638061 [Mycena metata]
MQSDSSNGSFKLEAPANSYLPFTVNRQASPVLALPPEITSEIFFQFLPDPPDFPLLSGPHSPLLLCQICRQWSSIALTLPQLWSMVRIVIQDERPAQVELFKTWLSRSGDFPLSISIRSLLPSISPPIRDLLQTPLAALSARLEHFELSTPSDDTWELLLGDMPLLRHLSFTLIHFSFDAGALTVFDRAPRLTHVILGEFYRQFIVRLPWTQITHLDVHELYLFECAETLCNAEHLVHCIFGVMYSDRNIEVPVAPPHQRLRHLILRAGSNQSEKLDLSKFLDRLTLPALRTFAVYERDLGLESLKACILRSRCALDELRITAADGTLSEMVYREALPSIQNIVLEIVEV